MSSFFLITLTILSTLFLLPTHPLILIIITIMTTTLTAWFTTQMMFSSWISLILMLIWLGGLLIIFIYLSALVPNELMKIKKEMLSISMILLIIFQPIILNSENYFQKKTLLFSSFSFNLLIPLILIYMIVTLCVSMFFTSMMKTPSKQESN